MNSTDLREGAASCYRGGAAFVASAAAITLLSRLYLRLQQPELGAGSLSANIVGISIGFIVVGFMLIALVKLLRKVLSLLGLLVVASCGSNDNPESWPHACSEQWIQLIEEKLSTGDSQGHGPDPGSMEWRSVVEFKLGVRGDPDVPSRDSEQWCAYVDEKIPEET